jgi:hypothetical protein
MSTLVLLLIGWCGVLPLVVTGGLFVASRLLSSRARRRGPAVGAELKAELARFDVPWQVEISALPDDAPPARPRVGAHH